MPANNLNICQRIVYLACIYHFSGEISASEGVTTKVKGVNNRNLRIEWKDSKKADPNDYALRYKTCDAEDSEYKYQWHVKSPALIKDLAPSTCFEISVGQWVNTKRVFTEKEGENEACTPCNRPFVSFPKIQGSCFLFQKGSFTWHEAKSQCESYGSDAHLVAIDSKVKNTVLKKYVSTEARYRTYWIDGTDETSEGNWIWSSSGRTIEFSDWTPGEPNDFEDNEDCAHLFGDYDWQWNDSHCTNTMGYICEIPSKENCQE